MKDTNPILLAEELKSVLQRYIATTLPISRRYPNLGAQFRNELQAQTLVEGPYVEALPDFEKGDSLEVLLTPHGGFLHPSLGKLPTAKRKLHRHQQRALELAGRDGKSILVATGTGSGKTESFLYPIAHSLLSDPEPDKPGVRALLIYPMNALANDQLYYRLAPLFGHHLLEHNITFGRYTGQVKSNTTRPEEESRIFNNRKLMEALGSPDKIPPNWLLTREEMLKNPPKVLVTNYAMLEHLLLLPKNERLFTANALRCIVLDEIHTYHGSQATEVAFLLRKLKNRLGIMQPLQVFGTSASLTDGEEANKQLIEFASNLFGEDVHEVVRGKRIVHYKLQGPITDEFSLSIQDWCLLGRVAESMVSQHEDDKTTETWNLFLQSEGLGRAELQGPEGTPFSALLGERFSRCREVRLVAHYLDNGGVKHFKDLAQLVFDASTGEATDSERYEALSAVIRMGMLARADNNGFPLLPGRYHIAVNSIEGLAVLPSNDDEGWSKLKPARHYRDEDGIYFPLLTCRKCGQPFLEGFDDGHCLHSRRPDDGDSRCERKVFWLGKPSGRVEDEDDAESDDTAEKMYPKVWLDIKTGELAASENAVALFQIATVNEAEEKAWYVKKCPSCGGSAAGADAEIVTKMHPGNEALGSVVTQRVLESLPLGLVDHADPRPAAGRNLLTFSDNRQDAAFFAPYFERTAGDIALRSAIRNVLKQRTSPITAPQLADQIYQYWQQENEQPVLLGSSGELLTDKQDAVPAIIGRIGFEFCTPGGRRNSLEALGVVGVTYDDPKLKLLIAQVKTFWPKSLPQDDVSIRALVHLLLETIRRERALAKFHGVAMKDAHIWETYNQHRTFDIEGGDNDVAYKWLPNQQQNRHNRRTWYLVEQLGLPKDEAFAFLRQFWAVMVKPPISFLERYQPGFGLNGELIRLTNGETQPMYVCDSCGLMQQHVVDGKCSAFKCHGKVHEISAKEHEQLKSNNHYLFSYDETQHSTVRAKEHTASLSTELRESIERDFVERRINLLSCTTTMEMGVDLGDLEAVVNLNVPPSIANYQQRTGRAGRRAQAAPFCVTVACNTNFDQAIIRDFRRYLASSPGTPFIHLDNTELFKRHQYSVLLSHFLRWRITSSEINAPSLKHLFGDVFGKDELRDFTDKLMSWLEAPEGNAGLQEADELVERLPEAHRTIGATGITLRNQFLGAVREFAEEIHLRFSKYTERMDAAATESEFKKAAYWKQMRDDFMGQFLVNQLSNRGLIPTYSFPVHSISLEVMSDGGKNRYQGQPDIVLSRDASMGISEYAPGAEVVANGRIWESAGLAHYPKAFMPERWYVACPDCYHVDIGDTAEDIGQSCSNCGSTEGRRKRRFLEPKGFVTSYNQYKGRDPSSSRRRVRPADEARLIAAPKYDLFEETGLPFMSTALLNSKNANDDKPRGALFIANRGTHGEGYHRCPRCNFAVAAKAARTPIQTARRRSTKNPIDAAKKFVHTDPVTGEFCPNDQLPKISLDFAHQFETDVRILRFITPLPEPESAEISARRYHERFARTMAEAIKHAASSLLDLHPGELRAIYRLYGGTGNRMEVVLYDGVPGGAGYCARIGTAGVSFGAMLERTRERLDCPAKCDSGCRVCLCDYGNQRYWDNFDRKAVLKWLDELLDPSQTVSGPGNYVRWNSPSLSGLVEQLENHSNLSFVAHSLVGNDFSEEVLGQFINWAQSGKTINIYLANKLEEKPTSQGPLTVYRRLHPYVIEGRIKLYAIPKEVKVPWETLPRVFTGSGAGQPLFRQHFALQSLMKSVIAAPVDIGQSDTETEAELDALLDTAQPYGKDALHEGEKMRMWEYSEGQPRDLGDIFSATNGAFIKRIELRDPYCGARLHTGKLEALLKHLKAYASNTPDVYVKCKETKDKDGDTEFYLDIERRVDDVIKGFGFENRDVEVLQFREGKRFHDRELDIHEVTGEGCDVVHRYFLTGGIDYLIDPRAETRIFYIRIEK